jgi:hypothetical protein
LPLAKPRLKKIISSKQKTLCKWQSYDIAEPHRELICQTGGGI